MALLWQCSSHDHNPLLVTKWRLSCMWPRSGLNDLSPLHLQDRLSHSGIPSLLIPILPDIAVNRNLAKLWIDQNKPLLTEATLSCSGLAILLMHTWGQSAGNSRSTGAWPILDLNGCILWASLRYSGEEMTKQGLVLFTWLSNGRWIIGVVLQIP